MPDPLSSQSTEIVDGFTPTELVVLTRAMAGVFLDHDAEVRPEILRKLAKSLKSCGILEVRT